VDAVECRTFFSRLISIFVFDILQIPRWCIQICSGRIAPTCTPLAIGLDTTEINLLWAHAPAVAHALWTPLYLGMPYGATNHKALHKYYSEIISYGHPSSTFMFSLQLFLGPKNFPLQNSVCVPPILSHCHTVNNFSVPKFLCRPPTVSPPTLLFD
jgi:hypothetical protein